MAGILLVLLMLCVIYCFDIVAVLSAYYLGVLVGHGEAEI